MNQNVVEIQLRAFMDSPEGWGRSQGREAYQNLIDFIEKHAGVLVFQISVQGVRRVDISFASETIIELARRYRGNKGFCFIDLFDSDMLENWDAAAERKSQPIMVWEGSQGRVIGIKPSQGLVEALRFALERPLVRAAEFAADNPGMSIANASSKFKQLWTQGFLLRREDVAESGGVEFIYYRIR
jgi:hypothetical protein